MSNGIKQKQREKRATSVIDWLGDEKINEPIHLAFFAPHCDIHFTETTTTTAAVEKTKEFVGDYAATSIRIGVLNDVTWWVKAFNEPSALRMTKNGAKNLEKTWKSQAFWIDGFQSDEMVWRNGFNDPKPSKIDLMMEKNIGIWMENICLKV